MFKALLRLIILVLFMLLSVSEAAAMEVSFFEEFPHEKTLEKIAQIDFDTRIYVAAKNLSQFYEYEDQFKAQNPQIKQVIYWPVLEKEEGYWISPWSDSAALERVFEEIKDRKDKKKQEVLLDLEPSLQRSRLLGFKDFRKNKEQIEEFVANAKEYNISLSTVEKSYIPEGILEYFDLSFNPEEFGNQKIKMYYSSYRRKLWPDFVVDKLFERKVSRYAEKGIKLGLGLIAPGIHNEAHYISPETLQTEVKIASDYGIQEVIIFRLEGLNEEYLKVLEKFVLNYSK